MHVVKIRRYENSFLTDVFIIYLIQLKSDRKGFENVSKVTKNKLKYHDVQNHVQFIK